MIAMKDFYPRAYQEFIEMLEKQEIHLPSGIASNLSDAQYNALYKSTIIHEKPLTNALGNDFSKILTKDRVIRMFQYM
jgi:3-deoxy-alpha-D-manno-octulosonate 8-oxidase